jgi:hypothetical protein
MRDQNKRVFRAKIANRELLATTPTSGQERPGSIMPSVKLNPPKIGLIWDNALNLKEAAA